jgi:hypothetical protein
MIPTNKPDWLEEERMDPVSIALSLLMKNPQAAGDMAQRAMAPGNVQVERMRESVADLGRGVLTCYHKTARFRSVDVLAQPWNRQGQYGADSSVVLRINYQGMTGQGYGMVVAVMAKDDRVRTAVLGDNAMVPYSKRCELEEWKGA